MDAKHSHSQNTHTGLLIALSIIASWLLSLTLLLSIDSHSLSIWLTILAILEQTFLYTGLFVTAHDGMHGTISTRYPSANKIVGSISLALYALFSFTELKQKHQMHHLAPATDQDPDFHNGKNKDFLRWYLAFMCRYLSLKQLIGMAMLFNILNRIIHIPVSNLILFWVMPALLSTLQLFYFGTYLPHRDTENDQKARSNNYSTLLSFVTCYHFGYHWEHHESPYTPWWQLPQKRHEYRLMLRKEHSA